MGKPFHVGCGQRTERRIGTLVAEMPAPGTWATPAKWALKNRLFFECPKHGPVKWDETRYVLPAERKRR